MTPANTQAYVSNRKLGRLREIAGDFLFSGQLPSFVFPG
jgi:hypothetical protein